MICVFSMMTYALVVYVFKRIYCWWKGKKFDAESINNIYLFQIEEKAKIDCPYLDKNPDKVTENMENPHMKKDKVKAA